MKDSHDIVRCTPPSRKVEPLFTPNFVASIPATGFVVEESGQSRASRGVMNITLPMYNPIQMK